MTKSYKTYFDAIIIERIVSHSHNHHDDCIPELTVSKLFYVAVRRDDDFIVGLTVEQHLSSPLSGAEVSRIDLGRFQVLSGAVA